MWPVMEKYSPETSGELCIHSLDPWDLMVENDTINTTHDNKHSFDSTQFLEKFAYMWAARMLLFVWLPFQFGLINLCYGFSKSMTGTEILTFIAVPFKMELAIAYMCQFWTSIQWCAKDHEIFYILLMSLTMW